MSTARTTTRTQRPWSQAQLFLPLLETLDDAGGSGLSAREASNAVAERIGLPESERNRSIEIGGQSYNAFDRDVRWVRQKASEAGLLATPMRGTWAITGKGKSELRMASPGVAITVWTDHAGRVIWGAIEDAIGLVDRGSVNLWCTSPPYPLANRQKHYGNLESRKHVDWLVDAMRLLLPTLTEDGSLVLNLGDVHTPGIPTLDLYAERLLLRLVDDLGLHLAGRFEWYNPAKMPAPAEWVTVRRVRTKGSLERCYWLSPSPHPKADNRGVLVPYSDSMRSKIKAGGERQDERPSGHASKAGAFGQDNGGAIPGNLIVAANTASSGGYMRYCREHGLPIHPARFPDAVPSFFTRLTTEVGDLVGDCFGGSMMTARTARDLGRRYVAVDKCLDYVMGGVGGRLAVA